jgi:hypothetical protein
MRPIAAREEISPFCAEPGPSLFPAANMVVVARRKSAKNRYFFMDDSFLTNPKPLFLEILLVKQIYPGLQNRRSHKTAIFRFLAGSFSSFQLYPYKAQNQLLAELISIL